VGAARGAMGRPVQVDGLMEAGDSSTLSIFNRQKEREKEKKKERKRKRKREREKERRKKKRERENERNERR